VKLSFSSAKSAPLPVPPVDAAETVILIPTIPVSGISYISIDSLCCSVNPLQQFCCTVVEVGNLSDLITILLSSVDVKLYVNVLPVVS